MQIKLIQSIRANGKQYRPPSVVDTKEISITDGEAEVLVNSGVATVFTGDVTDVEAKPEAEEAEAPAEEAPTAAKPTAAKPTAKKS